MSNRRKDLESRFTGEGSQIEVDIFTSWKPSIISNSFGELRVYCRTSRAGQIVFSKARTIAPGILVNPGISTLPIRFDETPSKSSQTSKTTVEPPSSASTKRPMLPSRNSSSTSSQIAIIVSTIYILFLPTFPTLSRTSQCSAFPSSSGNVSLSSQTGLNETKIPPPRPLTRYKTLASSPVS